MPAGGAITVEKTPSHPPGGSGGSLHGLKSQYLKHIILNKCHGRSKSSYKEQYKGLRSEASLIYVNILIF